MFKIESYITPILFSYVDKYIKNFRTEDSQVSLWGGDASFHNLDLRLEVLERELQLPFRFVSGHIHELLIHVPWTKLASEPISITINTIECKLELRSADAVGSEAAAAGASPKDARRRVRRQQQMEAPPGYIQSLVNRIVNNITILCNNVILKYEEEDIVLSVNAKTVTLQSANVAWEPAFVELVPPHIKLRKLISLSDLTVCLDKRNSSGKIDVYQEPLLYRCSMEVHLLRSYFSSVGKRPSVLRADVHCDRMDFRLTEQQVPMFLRLMQLCLALYRKELRPDKWALPPQTPADDAQPDDEELEDSEYGEESWVGWAWNLLPAMPLAWDDTGQSEGQPSSFQGRTVHMGFYVDNASIAFKMTESFSEKSYYGSRKVRFVPFLLLELQGCYLSCVLHGSAWLNTRLGVSRVHLQPSGQCFCGEAEADAVYLVSGREEAAFLKDSLFDPECVENSGNSRSYLVSWNMHVDLNTEALMLEKSPAFAVDYIYMLEIPDDFASEQISELGSDLEYSNLPEKSLCRLVLGPTTVDVCSGLLHRVQMIQHSAHCYEYSPYSVPKPDPTRDELPSVTEEDFEALDQNVPQQVIQVTLIKPVVRMFLPAHPAFNPGTHQAVKKKRKVHGQQQQQQWFLPSVVAECSCLDARITKPMYPRRLATITCQLVSPPHHMFSLCYHASTLQLMDVRCRVVVGQGKQTTVLTSSRMSYSRETLLHPQYWTDPNIAHQKLSFHVESMTTTFTKPKLLVVYTILRCLLYRDILLDTLRATTLLTDAAQEKGLEYLEVLLRDAQYRRVTTPATAAHSVQLGSLRAFVMEHLEGHGAGGREPLQAMVVSGPEGGAGPPTTSDAPLLTLTAQLPLDPAAQLHPPLLLFRLRQVDLCVDPLLWRWLQYSPEEGAGTQPDGDDSPAGLYLHQPQVRPHRKVSSDTGSESAGRHRSAPAPRESVHSSSDRELVPPARPPSIAEEVAAPDTPATGDQWGKEALLRWFPVWRGLVVQGDAGRATVYLPSSSLSAVGSQSIEEAVRGCGALQDVLVVRLPAVTLGSVTHKHGLPVCADHLPVRLPSSVWTPGTASFPWSVSVAEASCHTVQKGVAADVVAPFSAASTLIVTTKYRADKSTLSALGVCIHVDIKPIALSLSYSQMQLLVEVCVGGLVQVTQLLGMHNSTAQVCQPPVPQSPSPSVFKASEGSVASLVSSVNSADENESCVKGGHPDGQPDVVKVTLWMQSTLARVTVSLNATDSSGSDLRMTLDMEDIMTSLDLQRVYLKVISKVSSASVHHFKRNAPGEAWLPGPFLGLVMKGQEDAGVAGPAPHHRDAEDTSGGFLRVTFTRVRSRDAHSRWGARKPGVLLTTTSCTAAESAVIGSSSYISEVVVKLQAVDFVLSADTLSMYFPVFQPLLTLGEPTGPADSHHTTNRLLYRLSGGALPLLYVDTHAVRLVVPASDLVASPRLPNVCVLQVDAFNLKPKADNPLGRLVVRPEIYHHAERMHLLGVPGSEVEDRQYQLDVRGLTVHTGSWRELARVLGQPVSTASTLHTMSENPALEWNNLARCDEGILPHVTLLPIVSRLDLCAVAAPAVVYRGVLVCGASLEVGTTTSIHVSISLAQLLLAASLSSELLRLPGVRPSGSARGDRPRHRDEPDDSGVDCADVSSATDGKRSPRDASEPAATRSKLSYSSLRAAANRKSRDDARPKPAPPVSRTSSVMVPVEVLFTAGTVSCTLYEDGMGEWQQQSATSGHAVSPSPGDGVLPLLHVVLAEPHVFVSRLPLCHKMQASCFDVGVRCHVGRRTLSCRIPRQEDFPTPVLETKAGDPHQDTGIPPSFLTVVWSKSVGKAAVLELELGRPTKLHVGVELLRDLRETCKKLMDTFSVKCEKGERLAVEEDVNSASTWLQSFLLYTSKVHLKSQQLMVVFGSLEGWATSASLLGLSCSMSGPTHPPVDHVTLTSTVNCLTMSTSHCGDSRLLLNPWTFNTSVNVSWEDWNKQFTIPQTQISIDSDCIMLDLGPEHVLCLRYLWQEYGFSDCLSVDATVSRASSPQAGSSRPGAEPRQDQHYHDDLRAGAFRYSEMDSVGRGELPLPYQVAFWSDPPTMAWRYPQPRALTKVDVFPIPFQVVGVGDGSRDQVLCSLEYWSECRSSYQPYASFHLSENEMCRVELPQPPRLVTSYSWRVQMFVRRGSARDGGGAPGMSPRALAAGMLVDSFYSPSLVPRLQLAVCVPSLRVSLYNHLAEEDVPPVLEGYSMDSLAPESQCFSTLAVDELRGFLCSRSGDQGCRLLQVGGRVSYGVMDYAYLSDNCIVEPLRFRAEAVSAEGVEVSLVAEPLVLRLGPAAAHTLAVSAESWLRVLDSRSGRPVLLTRYVVCNNTMRPIRFGQVDTDEDILLMSRQCHAYAWRTHKVEPLLHVGIEEGLWVWCTSFPIHEDATLSCPLGDCGRKDLNVLVKVVSLSATQKMVVVSGQLVITNKLVQHLECQVVSLLDDNTKSLNDVQNFIVAGNSTLPSILINGGLKLVLRIRFHGQDGAWSGDIPLSENTKHFKPWLVKVPLQDKGQFLCIWCRIILQKVADARRGRILVVLCPLYMICSQLATSAKVTIDTPGLQVHLESTVKGRGEVQQLYCPGTIDHTHSLTFQLQHGVPSSDPVPLSYTMVDQREFFAQDFSGEVNIDDVVELLSTTKQPRWPYLGKEYDDFVWEPVDQPETDVRVKYEPLNEFCSTMLVSLQPWALMANMIMAEVSVVVAGKVVCRIPHKGVVSPSKLTGTFHLEVLRGDASFSSQALQFARREQNVSFYMPRIMGLIPVQGNTHICMQGSASLVFGNIMSDLVKEMHVISIQPRYIILNRSSSTLEVVAVVVSRGKKHRFTGGESVVVPADDKEGFPLLHFTKLADGDECVTPYVAFSGGAGFSCPIQLGTAWARQNFTVPCKDAVIKNTPYVLTTQERNGQVFLAVHSEPHPPLVVHNKCQFDFLCGQVSVDADGEMFEETAEFDWWCAVEGLSSAHYSMPLLSERFPSLGKWNAASHVALAIRSGDAPEWSLGLCILEPREQFVHIPRYGDVKVKIETVCHTAHLTVESVSHVEISARDIRSRLSNKDSHVLSQALVTSTSRGKVADGGKLPVDPPSLHRPFERETTVCSFVNETSFRQPATAKLEVFFQGLCIKMLDDLPKPRLDRVEVIILSLDGVCLEMEAYSRSSMRREICLSVIVGDLQLDNQMFHDGGFDFAVIFTGQSRNCIGTSFSLYAPAAKMIDQIRTQGLIKVEAYLEQFQNDHNEVFNGVKNLNIHVGPLCAYIEDTFVVRIVEYLLYFSPNRLIYVPKDVLEPRIASSGMIIPEEVRWSLDQLATPLRINSLSMKPMFLMMSIHTSVKLYIAIDHSPLNFASFDQQCLVTTPYRLGHALTMHYLYGAIFGAGWVVGSLELIGSPGGLARTVGTGLRDFVYLPYQGILQGPWGFLVGVTHGSASLMKHVTAGTLSSVTKLAASIARNIDRLSLDQEHLERTEKLRRQRPQGVTQGLIQGLTGLGISLLGAIGGIAHHPLQSVISSGASPRGLVTGVGRGLVGAVTKPLSGAAELLALTGQGLLHGTGWSTLPEVRRGPSVDHFCSTANSLAKYGWKLVAGLAAGRHVLLHVMDATLKASSKSYKPVALVLTTQALFVVGTEEDVTQRVLSLSELSVADNSSDPTLLAFQFKMPAMPMDMDPASHARVVDYVRHSTGMMNCGNEDSHSEAGTSQSESSFCDQSQFDMSLTFLVSPLWRDYFVSVLELAKRHSQGRGFAVL